MTSQQTDIVADLAARQKIGDLQILYCRGVDRCDVDTLKSVFWPDGVTRWGEPETNAWTWAEDTVARLRGMKRTQHSITNAYVELDGDRAIGETHCRAYLETPDGQSMMVGGRYLDRYERRQGIWKIAYRAYVLDWNANEPATGVWDGPLYGMLNVRGGRQPDDPLYRHRLR
jgi:hypothetical protein